jgi:hypothetical protein
MTRFGTISLIVIILLLGGIGYLFYRVISMEEVIPVDPYFSHITTQEGNFVYSEISEYYDISFSYPVALPSVVLNDIENYFKEQIAQFKIDGNFDKLTPEDIEILGFHDGRKYTLDFRYVFFQSDNIESHMIESSVFTGGAHGNQAVELFNYDKSFNRISLEDVLLDEESLKQIASLITSKIVEKISSENDSSALFSEGLEPVKENFQHFYITDSAVHFIFPPYQILPYSYGMVDISLPFEEVYSYVAKQFIPKTFEKPTQEE